MVEHESWLQRAQSLQSDAETLTSQMVKHQEEMRLTREQAKMAYLTQVEATNYALRKTLYQANKLKNELQWQRKTTLEEMAKIQAEIDGLRVNAAEQENLLKCAETRMEDRNVRPAYELVKDNPHSALIEEIMQLRQNLKVIRENIDRAMIKYNKLDAVANRLAEEIASKELCIQLEMRTLDARANLLEHQPISSLDREAVLVKMEKQIAPAQVC